MDTPQVDDRQQYKGPSFTETESEVLQAVDDSGQEIGRAKRAVPGEQRGAALMAHGDPQGPARLVNVDGDAPRSVCRECGQPIVQFQNGGWAHANPNKDTCGDPDPTPAGTVAENAWDEDDRTKDPIDELMDKEGPQLNGGGGGAAEVMASWDRPDWYDGTATSVRERIAVGLHLSAVMRTAGEFDLAERLGAEAESLRPVATELERDAFEEHVANLPGHTVASEYGDLVEGGLLDIGPDDGSFLYTAAHDVQEQLRDYDWERFAAEGPRSWLERQARNNPGVLRREAACREAAVDYVQGKTLALLDVERRAQVVDAFVTEAERLRRTAYAGAVGQRMRREAARATLEQERADAVIAALESETSALWT